MESPNLELLTNAAELLKPLLDELVFVGGCIAALLITDQASGNARPTYDVDAIAAITSRADYITFSERLHKLGFTEDTREDAPICRWRNGETILDVMPLDERILGFSNRWYEPAMEYAEERELKPGLRIRVVSASYFCATKFDAFRGRGANDYFSSHDLEDLIAVIDGRPQLVDELRSAPDDVRTYVASEISRLLSTTQCLDALPGYLLPDSASQARVGSLLERLRELSAL